MWTVLVLALIGLLLGSWLSVVTWRYPQGKNFIKGRSLCPHCNKTIAWYDNIPIVSYLLLKGKCRFCRQKISLRYPLIEIAAALGFIGIYFLRFLYPLAFVLWGFLLAIVVIDLERRLVLDMLVFIPLGLLIIFYLFFDYPLLYPSFFAGFLASLLLLLLHLATRGRGMGLGDVKLALLAGMIVGWPKVLAWLVISFWLGAAYALPLLFFKKANLKTKVSFGPFLVLSLIITCLWGEKLIRLLL